MNANEVLDIDDSVSVDSPQIPVETKFMHNYRPSKPAHARGEIVSVRNRNGALEFFTTGTDGSVWNYYPNPSGAAGYSSVRMPIAVGENEASGQNLPFPWKGAKLAAGVDDQGHIVVFAVDKSLSHLYSCHETDVAGARWSKPELRYSKGESTASAFYEVFAKNVNDGLLVGVVKRIPTPNRNPEVDGPYTRELSYSVWPEPFQKYPLVENFAGSGKWTWAGKTKATAAAVCRHSFDDQWRPGDFLYILGLGFLGGFWDFKWMGSTITKVLSIDSGINAFGNAEIIAVVYRGFKGPRLHRWAYADHGYYDWLPISSPGIRFRQVEVEVDSDGKNQIFAVAEDNRLYHLKQDAKSQTGYTEPAPIARDVEKIAVGRNDRGNIDIFAIGAADGLLTHMFRQAETWQKQDIQIPAYDAVEEYISYSSDITLNDANGAPLMNKKVSITTSSEAQLTVNGKTYFTDATHPAKVTTNSLGVLSVSQETDSLSVPALQLHAAELMTEEQSLPIEQCAVVQDKLKKVTGPELRNAKDGKGNHLLEDKFRTEKTTDSLATAFTEIMKLTDRKVGNFSRFQTVRGAKPGVHFRNYGTAADLNLLAGSDVVKPWSLTFEDDGTILYRELTSFEAGKKIAASHALANAVGDSPTFFESIADFVRGLASGFIKIVELTITTLAKGINAVFTFVIDGITRVYNAIVDTVKDVFGVIESILAAVKVAFEKAFEWLGYLFDWDDIKRSHLALSYSIEEMLKFFELAAPRMKVIVDNEFLKLQENMVDKLDKAINDIAGTSTIGSYKKSKERHDPRTDSALANNVFLNALVNSDVSAQFESSVTATANLEDLEPLLQKLKDFAANAQSKPEFSSVSAYFNSIAGGGIGQFFTQPLKTFLELMKALGLAILCGVRALIAQLFDIMHTLIGYLRTEIVTKKFDKIPFLSEFYESKMGTPLTALSLVSLAAAIPTTILYKLIGDGKAPFPDESSITAFKREFSAQTMLRMSGLGTALQLTDDPLGVSLEVSKRTADIMKYSGAIFTAIYGCFSSLLDVLGDLIGETGNVILSASAILVEIGSLVCGFPWLTIEGTDSVDFDGSGFCWIVGLFGVFIDVAFLVKFGSLPENEIDNDWKIFGVGTATCFGVVDCVVHFINCTLAENKVAAIAFLLPTIPEVCKFLLAPTFTNRDPRIRLVVGGIDVVFYGVSAGMQVFA